MDSKLLLYRNRPIWIWNRRLTMEYIIIPIVILLVIILVIMQQQKKHKTILVKLEEEKSLMQNKPINEELTKVKTLNMNGQTEEMFERWRKMNDEIKVTFVKKIDDLLFDVEDSIRALKFKRATAYEEEIREYLKRAAQDQQKILDELNELMGSEEKNRVEMEELRETYRTARKTLLAHQHAFGAALPALEERLEAFEPASELFERLTEQGNYLEARELVLSLQTEAQLFLPLIQDIPGLLTDIQTNIPTALDEIRTGYKEMEAQGYYLRHLELQIAFTAVDEELAALKKDIANLHLETIQPRVEHLNQKIDGFYDVLENEVVAKQYTDRHGDALLNTIFKLMQNTRKTLTEAEYVQESYRLSAEDAEVPRDSLRHLEVLQKRYDILAQQIAEEQSAYSSLREELQAIELEMESIAKIQESFEKRLANLRVHENDARERLTVVERQLVDIERKLQKANTPGVPHKLQAKLDDVAELIYVVKQNLQEVPLNMEEVKKHLTAAETNMLEAHAAGEEMIEKVVMIERIIQYGNRYRSTNAMLDERLTEAEQAFNARQYTKALEEAGNAVEAIEPGALARIQQVVQQDLEKVIIK